MTVSCPAEGVVPDICFAFPASDAEKSVYLIKLQRVVKYPIVEAVTIFPIPHFFEHNFAVIGYIIDFGGIPFFCPAVPEKFLVCVFERKTTVGIIIGYSVFIYSYMIEIYTRFIVVVGMICSCYAAYLSF